MNTTAVAILNWNGKSFLEKFLPSVAEFSKDNADIYVIDNASTDASIPFLREFYPFIHIIPLDKNHGFARGYNLGLQQIPNATIVLLNSDVEVTHDWIRPVLEYMDSDPLLVACQPKILDHGRRSFFEYAGAAGGYIDRDGFVFCAGRIFNEFERDEGQYHTSAEVFWASGAALFIRRSAYFEAGGLDEDFYAHMEEIDLCWRLKNRGYKIGACRASTVFHVGGGTLDRLNPFKTYLNFRNNLYLLLKNHHTSPIFLKMFKRMALDGAAALHFLSEGKWSYFTAVLRAHWSFYRHIPMFMTKRSAESKSLHQPNLHGRYRRSIIRAFFLKGKKKFGDLQPDQFS